MPTSKLLTSMVTGLALSVGFAHSGWAATLAQSTFDVDVDGWQTVITNTAGTSNITFVAGGGNPGGAIRHNAPSDSQTSFFLAPSKFVTGLHSAVGGSIAWDEATLDPAGAGPYFSDIDIQVAAGANRLRHQLTPPAPSNHPLYSHYGENFDTLAGWAFFDGTTTSVATQAQIDAVLGGATSLVIRAEYFTGNVPDTAFLDNVILANTRIPNPSSLSLLALGLTALGLTRLLRPRSPQGRNRDGAH